MGRFSVRSGEQEAIRMSKDKPIKIPEDCAVVACGTLRREMLHLSRAGFVDSGRVFFTAPGLHEWPHMLRTQLTRQLDKARSAADRVVVLYGEKCYFDVEAGVDTDMLLAEFTPGVVRVAAKNCVDMLADKNERNRLADGKKVYWLTPGWIEHWNFIFKDWDGAKANETFSVNDGAILLDAVGYFHNLSETDPEKILRICDWMKLQIAPERISLERLKAILLDSVQQLGAAL